MPVMLNKVRLKECLEFEVTSLSILRCAYVPLQLNP